MPRVFISFRKTDDRWMRDRIYKALINRFDASQCIMAARIDLAAARLRLQDLDAARTSADPVLAIAPANRMYSLAKRFGSVRTALAASRYRGSAEARDFDVQIEQFCRATTATTHVS